MTQTIAVLVGSLRKGSFSRQLAHNFADLLPEGQKAQFIKIGDLPFYNQDFDTEGPVPESYVRFRQEIRDSAGVIL